MVTERMPATFVLALALALQDGEPRDVSSLLASLVETHGVPALAGAVVREGEVVAIGAAGVRRRGDDARVTAEDRFHLGSCTKAMTAALCAMLVEEGKLGWHARPGDVLDLEDVHEGFAGATLEQLLRNRGGAPAEIEQEVWACCWSLSDEPLRAREMLASAVLSRPPSYPPGSARVYSNAGYAIAGHMAEVAAGRPWSELMRERIFEPLGMRSAGFGAPGVADALDEPRGHRPSGEPVEPGPRADNPSAIAPAGAVHASIADWARYAEWHLAGARGQAEGLSRASFERLHDPVDGYAMGWLVTERPWAAGSALTHSGSNTMWYATVWLAPGRDLAVLAACNEAGERGPRAVDAACAELLRGL